MLHAVCRDQDASSLADSLRFQTIRDYEDWIARMQALPEYMDQTIALMRTGIRERRVHPKVIMKRLPAQIARQIVDKPEQSLFFKPFRNMPSEYATALLISDHKTAQNPEI